MRGDKALGNGKSANPYGTAHDGRKQEPPGSDRSVLVAGKQPPLPKPENEMAEETPSNDSANRVGRHMTFAEFVERHFVPEYVARKSPSGQAHFQAILKHVMRPEHVKQLFRDHGEKSKGKRERFSRWPYLDTHRLSELQADTIQNLIAAMLENGYSTQTVTHIRSVLRAIFAHATRTSCYRGDNPADLVTVPTMERKEQHTLTLPQLAVLIPAMSYPELVIALLAIQTDMNVAEICGLQWRCVNLSNHRGRIDGGWLPPTSIAVRRQRYRGDFTPVLESKRRFVPIPSLLFPILSERKSNTQFTSAQDFVLVSRRGTPVHPENIAARRLKSIGHAYGMPWLSWQVFHRTRIALRAEFGDRLNSVLEEIVASTASAILCLARSHYPDSEAVQGERSLFQSRSSELHHLSNGYPEEIE